MKRDIDDFSYADRVESKKNKFSILSLSDNGFKEYIEKDSYTHFYLYEKHLDRYNKEVDERLRNKNERKVRELLVRDCNNVNGNTVELNEKEAEVEGEIKSPHVINDEKNVK